MTRVCFGRRFNLHCMCGWIVLERHRYLGYSTGAGIQAEIEFEMSALSLSLVAVMIGCLAGASACGVCVAGSYSNSSGIHQSTHDQRDKDTSQQTKPIERERERQRQRQRRVDI